MRHLVLLTALCIGISVVVSPVSASAEEGTCPSRLTPPESVRIEVHGELDSQQIYGICWGVSLFAEVFPIDGSLPPMNIYVYDSNREAIRKFAKVAGWSVSRASRFWNRDGFSLDGAVFESSVVIHAKTRASRDSLMGVTAHELTHVLQNVNNASRNDYWLLEGSARYVEGLASTSIYGGSPDVNLISLGKLAQGWNPSHPQDLRSSRAFENAGQRAYNAAYVAFSFLISDVGFDAYATCYVQERGSFGDCFGTTIGDFYESYTAWSENGFVVPAKRAEVVRWCGHLGGGRRWAHACFI